MASASKGCPGCHAVLEVIRSKMEARDLLLWDTGRETFRHYRPGTTSTGGSLIIGEYEFFYRPVAGLDGAIHDGGSLSNHVQITTGEESSGDTGSVDAFHTLKAWISTCQNQHTLCAANESQILPHRIIRIESIEPVRVRLIEHDTATFGKYICLSYRWGSDTRSKALTTKNREEFKEGVPETSLYPLVKDAMSAAWNLGIYLIWIDSYCIIQDDDADWRIEAPKMADVYANAFATFSATSAADGRGMFSRRRPECEGKSVANIHGAAVFMRSCLWHPTDLRPGAGPYSEDSANFTAAPDEFISTLTRGWVFQERMLSHRFIHFSRDEISWECRESTWCECGHRQEDWKALRQTHSRVLHDAKWESIIQLYLRTRLTRETDRLVAISGLARQYGEFHRQAYMAGVWAEDLQSLLWWRSHTGMHKRLATMKDGIPTWSWASADLGHIYGSKLEQGRVWLRFGKSDLVGFVSYEKEPNTTDLYGQFDKSKLTITGFIMPGTLRGPVHNQRKRAGVGGTAFVDCALSHELDRGCSEGDHEAWLLVCGQVMPWELPHGIVLLPVDGERAQREGLAGTSDMVPCFRRVGTFTASDWGVQNSPRAFCSPGPFSTNRYNKTAIPSEGPNSWEYKETATDFLVLNFEGHDGWSLRAEKKTTALV